MGAASQLGGKKPRGRQTHLGGGGGHWLVRSEQWEPLDREVGREAGFAVSWELRMLIDKMKTKEETGSTQLESIELPSQVPSSGNSAS